LEVYIQRIGANRRIHSCEKSVGDYKSSPSTEGYEKTLFQIIQCILDIVKELFHCLTDPFCKFDGSNAVVYNEIDISKYAPIFWPHRLAGRLVFYTANNIFGHHGKPARFFSVFRRTSSGSFGVPVIYRR